MRLHAVAGQNEVVGRLALHLVAQGQGVLSRNLELSLQHQFLAVAGLCHAVSGPVVGKEVGICGEAEPVPWSGLYA